jgi:hypothetical protein
MAAASHPNSFPVGELFHRASLIGKRSLVGFLASAALAPAAKADVAPGSPDAFAATKASAPLTASFRALGEESSQIAGTDQAPYKGTGAWATHTGKGYFIRTVHDGDTMDRTLVSPSGKFTHGTITDRSSGTQYCATIATIYVKKNSDDTLDLGNPCRNYIGEIKDHPETIFKDPNYKPGEGSDGTLQKIKPRCNHTAWDGFTPAGIGPLNLNGAESGPDTPVGKERKPVYYRATFVDTDEKGRSFSVVRSKSHGWDIIRRPCIRFHSGALLKYSHNFD